MEVIDKVISTPSDDYEEETVQVKKEHRFALYENQGKRPAQEDAAFACWYAEHAFASLTPEEIGRRLWTTYRVLNEEGANQIFGGTTASTTVYDGRGHLITATLADSVAFAVVYGLDSSVMGVLRLNEVIHHPLQDLARIRRVGGSIEGARMQGGLAVSRALGDYKYRAVGVCDEAHIDIHRVNDICSRFSSLGLVGKVQIITACDGFTEPVKDNTKKGHEQWLQSCLEEIRLPGQYSELDLAHHLATQAFAAGSGDNISIAVQTLFGSMPWMMGIYDGHGGASASTYVAEHLGEVFEAQCALTQERYAQQDLSADTNFVAYCRDNKDEAFYLKLAAEETVLRASNELGGFKQAMIGMREKITEYHAKPARTYYLDRIEQGARGLYAYMNTLYEQYLNLRLDKEELSECIKYVLEDKNNIGFKYTKYDFLSVNFKQQSVNAELLKENADFKPIIDNVLAAFEPDYDVAALRSI